MTSDRDLTLFLKVAVPWLAVAIGGTVLALSDARGHEAPSGWSYDPWCCSGNQVAGDCQEIPTTSVKPIPGGYQITLDVGDHRLVSRLHVFQIPQAETRDSPDGRFHACLHPTEDNLRCFYAPPVGF